MIRSKLTAHSYPYVVSFLQSSSQSSRSDFLSEAQLLDLRLFFGPRVGGSKQGWNERIRTDHLIEMFQILLFHRESCCSSSRYQTQYHPALAELILHMILTSSPCQCYHPEQSDQCELDQWIWTSSSLSWVSLWVCEPWMRGRWQRWWGLQRLWSVWSWSWYPWSTGQYHRRFSDICHHGSREDRDTLVQTPGWHSWPGGDSSCDTDQPGTWSRSSPRNNHRWRSHHCPGNSLRTDNSWYSYRHWQELQLLLEHLL